MALFVTTGGICIKGDLRATPMTNSIILAIGWVLASFMGTTGAAMLLIRLLINTISERKYKAHTILFFIAIVANCGGLLTPLGDPPLFLLPEGCRVHLVLQPHTTVGSNRYSPPCNLFLHGFILLQA